MTPTFPYRFAVAMFDEGGVSVGTYVAQRDWEPVCEWTRFYYQRRGELPLDGDTSASVLPLWRTHRRALLPGLSCPACSVRAQPILRGLSQIAFSRIREVGCFASDRAKETA